MTKKKKISQIRSFSKDERLVRDQRQRITTFSAKLFVKKGYLKTSIREVANACGMSIGQLYHYIGSKDDILILFGDQTSSWVSDFTERILGIINKFNAEDSLRYAIKEYMEWANEIQDIIIFWYQETRNLPKSSRNCIFDMEAKLVDMFSKVLARGCRTGEFKIDDITLSANNIIILLDMWAFRRWSLARKFMLGQYVQYQTNHILNSIKTK